MYCSARRQRVGTDTDQLTEGAATLFEIFLMSTETSKGGGTFATVTLAEPLIPCVVARRVPETGLPAVVRTVVSPWVRDSVPKLLPGMSQVGQISTGTPNASKPR